MFHKGPIARKNNLRIPASGKLRRPMPQCYRNSLVSLGKSDNSLLLARHDLPTIDVLFA